MKPNFETVYSRLEPKIRSYLIRGGILRLDLDDVMQEIQLRLWQSWERLDPNREILPWVYTIARNERNRWLARQGRLVGRGYLEDGSLEGPSAESLVEHRLEGLRVRKALQTLEPDLYEIVLLKFYQHLSFQETAAVLNLPPSTVKSRLYKALKELQRRLW